MSLPFLRFVSVRYLPAQGSCKQLDLAVSDHPLSLLPLSLFALLRLVASMVGTAVVEVCIAYQELACMRVCNLFVEDVTTNADGTDDEIRAVWSAIHTLGGAAVAAETFRDWHGQDAQAWLEGVLPADPVSHEGGRRRYVLAVASRLAFQVKHGEGFHAVDRVVGYLGGWSAVASQAATLFAEAPGVAYSRERHVVAAFKKRLGGEHRVSPHGANWGEGATYGHRKRGKEYLLRVLVKVALELRLGATWGVGLTISAGGSAGGSGVAQVP